MNNYIHVIDTNGKRITSIVIDILTTSENALEQTESIAPNCVYIEGGDDMLDKFLDGKIYKNGTFVEPPVVEYIQTKEEKINAIKSEYEPRFKKLQEAQQKLMLMGKSTDTISTQYINLNNEMVSRIKGVQ